jgi:hypothetical protein
MTTPIVQNLAVPKPEEFRRLTTEEVKARGKRNLAIGLILGGMVVIFFIVTFVQLAGTVAQDKF